MIVRLRAYFAWALIFAATALLTSSLGTAPAWAQLSQLAAKKSADAPIETPNWDALRVEERRDLLSRLSDEQVREIIIGQLDRAADAEGAQPDSSSMISGMQARAHMVRQPRPLMFLKNLKSTFKMKE